MKKNAGNFSMFTVMVVLLITASAYRISSHTKSDLPPAAELTMYWIDTEGGAATLIITPSGESILIDTGNPGGRDSDRIYEVARHVAGLKQIDHLITTHWHNDHFGGAALLAAKMPVIEVIDKGIADSLLNDKSFAESIQAYRDMKVAKHSMLVPGANISLKNLPAGYQRLSMRFAGTSKKFVPVVKTPQPVTGCENIPGKAFDNSDNANSQVLVMDYGPFRFFDGGDLTWNIEKTLVCPVNLIGTVDVYQVNHHGLDQSNNPLLVTALSPTVSIMGNGPQKGCGPETISTLRGTSSIKAQYQLHKNVRPDSTFNTGSDYIANLKANCNGEYVKLTVSADGKKYKVIIPATGHEKTFETKMHQ